MENYLSQDTNKMLERTNDEILWSGQSKPFSIFSPFSKASALIRWAICLGAFLILGFIYFLVSTKNNYFNPLFIIILFCVLVVIAILPFTDRNLILKQCHYYITKDRIIYQRDGMPDVIFNRKGILINVTPERNGCVSIAFGTSSFAKESKLFTKTINPDSTLTTNINTGCVFLNVEYTDELKELLK